MTPRDIIFFSGEDWTPFSQRPQSLAIEFARRGNRCFYIEPMLSLGKIVARRFAGGGRATDTGEANVVRLKPLLSLSRFRGSKTRPFDKRIFRFWFERQLKRYGIRRDALVYLNLPYWWDHVIDRHLFPDNTVIFDCIDDCRVYSGSAGILKIMQSSERKLAQDADHILASAYPLYARLQGHKSVHYLPNAIDLELCRDPGHEPAIELPPGNEFVFGFVGSLNAWIDFAVFEKIAERWPRSTVVVIGPTSRPAEIRRLADKHRNLRYLGPVPHKRIFAYIRQFDICLNPKSTDEIGDNMNPLKIYEYLAMGKPVVSSRTREMLFYADKVYLYGDDLLETITRALGELDDQALQSQRREFSRHNTWKARVDSIEQILGWS